MPNTGADVGTWGAVALNPDFVAIDGMLAGVTSVSLSNVNVTLTHPAAAVAPGAGPVQSQNALIKFTGTLTGDVIVTFPLPGRYYLQNATTGAFNIKVVGVAPSVVQALPPGQVVSMFCDGNDMYFINDVGTSVGKMEMWAGLNVMPGWVGACTFKPYLLCDGTIYNVADFPYLGARLGANFGGNGITTFGVPDMRGRVPLAYDGTGGRITVAGCGINGQTLGAALDAQTVMLAAIQIPSLTSLNASQAIAVQSVTPRTATGTIQSANVTGGSDRVFRSDAANEAINSSGNNSISVTYTNAGQTAVNNVQPSQVTGIWVIKT